MKIFVGYGYNANDGWIEDLVFRLIEAFGDEVRSGKEVFGEQLSDAVRAEIKDCDALIGFTTRREKIVSGKWTTHEWVQGELLTAANGQPPMPFVEVRETDVDPQHGMLTGIAHITYNKEHTARCLVELAQVLGKWHRKRAASASNTVQFLLMPEDFAQEVGPLIRNPDLRCVYYVLGRNDTDPSAEKEAKVLKLKSRELAIRTGAVPEDASIMVEVWQGRTKLLWTSDWQPVNSRTIHLDKAS